MLRPRKIAYEEFAEFAASGLSLAESYRRTTGQTKNADVKGTQWHGYAGIKERIAELKNRMLDRAQMTRDELLAFYAEVIRTPADQVPAGSPVIQAYEQDSEGRVKVRICDKATSGAQLARMCGWNEPDKVEMSADSLTSYLLELRSRLLGDYGRPVEGFTVGGDKATPTLSSVPTAKTICSRRWRSKMSVPAEFTREEVLEFLARIITGGKQSTLTREEGLEILLRIARDRKIAMKTGLMRFVLTREWRSFAERRRSVGCAFGARERRA